jgi:hypothetical protein
MTLAQARGQVWTRWIFGTLIMALAVIELLLILVKHLYLSLPGDIGKNLRQPIDQILPDSAVLSQLWQVLPTWTPTSPWNYVYVVWGAIVVIGIGGSLLKSARDRQALIRQMRQELERDTWTREALGQVASSRARQARDIDQYPAPSEPWSKKPLGIVILGMVVTVIGGLLLHPAKTLLFTNVR